MNKPKYYSIVFSVFNEGESLPLLYQQFELLNNSGHKFEILFVNDGSSDNSLELIKSFINQNNYNNLHIRYVSFSRNFGHEAAMIAGIDHAEGDAVICMDTDLQHPVELIPEMIEKYEGGADIVIMAREQNEGNSFFKAILSKGFYRFFNRISALKLKENVSDFFLVSKKVADVLRKNYRERNRFLRGLIQLVGFNTETITYRAPGRKAGVSKYSFSSLIVLTFSSIISFSKRPLFLGIYFGFFFALFAVILGIYTLITYIIGNTPPSGYTTIVMFISISFSILFFLIGIIGIYVGYVFDEIKKRPIYIVDESV